MARPRKSTTKKKDAAKIAPELVHEDGYWWIISGTKRINVGRNKRYAENLLAEQSA